MIRSHNDPELWIQLSAHRTITFVFLSPIINFSGISLDFRWIFENFRWYFYEKKTLFDAKMKNAIHSVWPAIRNTSTDSKDEHIYYPIVWMPDFNTPPMTVLFCCYPMKKVKSSLRLNVLVSSCLFTANNRPASGRGRRIRWFCWKLFIWNR